MDANDILNGGPDYVELSGLGSPSGGTAYLTGAIASTGKPIPVVATNFNGTIPLGFSPTGTFGQAGGSTGTAVKTGASVVFGASISGGTDANTKTPIPINPNSVVLTSPEVAGFTQPLKFSFSTSNTGPLASATYSTSTFTLPFTTPGIHALRVAVADQASQSSTTDFDVVVVSPTDAAAYVQVQDADGNPVTGATVSIDGADANGYVGAGETAPAAATSSVSDVNGVAIVFAVPGAPAAAGGPTNTLTVTIPGAGGTTFTQAITLTPGTATVTVAAPPTAAAAAQPRKATKVVPHHSHS